MQNEKTQSTPPKTAKVIVGLPSHVVKAAQKRGRTLLWLSAVGLCFCGILWTMAHAKGVFVPMFVAFGSAYALNPLVDLGVKKGLNRLFAIGLLLLIFMLGSIVVCLIVGPLIVREVYEVPVKLRQVLEQLTPWAQRIFDVTLPDSFDSMLAAMQAELVGHTQNPMGALARRASGLIQMALGGTVSALATLGGVIMVPFFTFFLLRDFHPTVKAAISLLPHRIRPWAKKTLSEIDLMLSGFIRGQLIVGTILAVLYSIGFVLCGMPLGLLVGVVTGVGNMLPFVGTAVGLCAATLMGFLGWHGVGGFISIYVVFVVIHLIEAWFITPRIVGNRVGMPAFWVIVSILLCGELFGFVGLLLAVPMAATLRILLRETLSVYRRSEFFLQS